MANQGVRGKQRQLKELRDLKKSLSSASARAEIDAAIERVENAAAKSVRSYGRKKRKKPSASSRR